MTYAKRLGRKVRRSKKKQAEEKPLRRWDQKRLERDEAEQALIFEGAGDSEIDSDQRSGRAERQ